MTSLWFDTASTTGQSATFERHLTDQPGVAVARSRRALKANVFATACSVGVAVQTFGPAGYVVWLSTVYVALVLFVEMTTVPSYEWLRSLRPMMRMLGLGGFVVLGALSLELIRPIEARGAIVVVVAAATVRIVAFGAERLRRQPRSVLLVGDGEGVGTLIGQWAGRPDVRLSGICLAEFVAESAPELLGVPILGSLEDVASVAATQTVDQVIVVPGSMVSDAAIRRLSWSLERSPIELLVAANAEGVEPHRIRPMVLGQRLILSVRPSRPSTSVRLMKAAMDRVGAAMLIIILAPVLTVLALLIRRDSPGPATFKQTRIGLDGLPFTMLKFRTMVVDAESLLNDLLIDNEGCGPLFKLNNDPRTTRVGRWLRRSSLDELPQLFNVLVGHMSLVGPRPSLPNESEQYDDWVRRRLAARPGMTGSWQVSGRSNLSWADSVRLDLDYVDNRTIGRDLSIAARTGRAVIRRDGAL